MSFLNARIGNDSPDIINVVIEISRGSHNKYEIDKETGLLTLDRVLYSRVHYPTDYGLIPETLSDDGDHLDALVLGSDPIVPGTVVRARPVGMLRMVDDGEKDYKILAVQADNPRFDGVNDIKDLKLVNDHFLKETEQFFETYKNLQNKKVVTSGWLNSSAAKKEIAKAHKLATSG